MSTEDTTAQLQIDTTAIRELARFAGTSIRLRFALEGAAAEIDRLRADLIEAYEVHVDNHSRQADGWKARAEVAEAQVEAAKATARREALTAVADELDEFHRNSANGWFFANLLRARASAQGVAPAEEDGCATTTAPATATSQAVTAPVPGVDSGSATERTVDLPNGFREHFGLTGTYATSKTDSADPQRSGGQGAQSSGHRVCIYCGFDSNPGLARCPDHIASVQRGPGQPGEQDG